MKATIYITLKNGVLDPQGKAIENALERLGFDTINEVRQGKLIEMDMEAASADAAHTQLTNMCEQLLANTVIENYRIQIAPQSDAME